jgi:hypothetical protein
MDPQTTLLITHVIVWVALVLWGWIFLGFLGLCFIFGGAMKDGDPLHVEYESFTRGWDNALRLGVILFALVFAYSALSGFPFRFQFPNKAKWNQERDRLWRQERTQKYARLAETA